MTHLHSNWIVGFFRDERKAKAVVSSLLFVVQDEVLPVLSFASGDCTSEVLIFEAVHHLDGTCFINNLELGVTMSLAVVLLMDFEVLIARVEVNWTPV